MKKYENCIVLLMGFAATGKFTVAKILEKYPNFILLDDHSVNNAIFRLTSLHEKTPISDNAQQKIKKLWSVFFETIDKVSPKQYSFIMTQEMIDDEEHAADFYQHLLKVAEHRKSLFVPVRLICSEDELVKRVKIEERHSAYKAIDVDRAIDLTQRHKVFQSNHPHEITVNNTDIYPGEAAKIIIEHIDAIQRKAADNT